MRVAIEISSYRRFVMPADRQVESGIFAHSANGFSLFLLVVSFWDEL